MAERTISDGWSEWTMCSRPDCDLQVVRPGRVQCRGERDGIGCVWPEAAVAGGEVGALASKPAGDSHSSSDASALPRYNDWGGIDWDGMLDELAQYQAIGSVETVRALVEEVAEARRAQAELTVESLSEVLKRADAADLIGSLFEVGWYDGPIYGFAVSEEVIEALAAIGVTPGAGSGSIDE